MIESAEELPWSDMIEADVRAHVLDPMLAKLGYKLSGQAVIKREQKLRYPALFLGRKKPGRDLQLRGVADYTLEVKRHARWTLEAKAPSQPLDEEVLQQAWSYAIHPEVQASYFAISNGRELKVYATSAAWGLPPLLHLRQAELLTSGYDELAAWLGPVAIARHHPDHLLAVGRPLAPALRAFSHFASGTISYERSTIPLPLLSQMQVSIVDGTLRRNAAGQLQAQLKTMAPFRELQAHIESMELDVHDYRSESETLSLTAERPTVFEYANDHRIDFALDPVTFRLARLPVPMRVQILARAEVHLAGNLVAGRFSLDVNFHKPFGVVQVRSEGRIELRLA